MENPWQDLIEGFLQEYDKSRRRKLPKQTRPVFKAALEQYVASQVNILGAVTEEAQIAAVKSAINNVRNHQPNLIDLVGLLEKEFVDSLLSAKEGKHNRREGKKGLGRNKGKEELGRD